jgi:hypothetical protein
VSGSFRTSAKTYGFGEPDALVVAGGHVFWVEVETSFDLQRGVPAARQALLQLERFRLLAGALAQGPKVRRVGSPHQAILGVTVTNAMGGRPAVVKCAGHPVLQKLQASLSDACANDRSHYVLLVHGQPVGPGKGKAGFGLAVENERRSVSEEVRQALSLLEAETGLGPPPAQSESHWYCYWQGDLGPKWAGTDPLTSYVSRKTR